MSGPANTISRVTDLRYGWLPDRHLAVAATLSHADEIIGQIVDLLVDYQSQPDGIIGLSQMLAGTSTRATVSRVAPLPLKLPLLVADALVALRAALEHVLFAEVEFRDGAPLDSKAARLVEMPAADTYEKFEEWLKKRAQRATVPQGGQRARHEDQGSAAVPAQQGPAAPPARPTRGPHQPRETPDASGDGRSPGDDVPRGRDTAKILARPAKAAGNPDPHRRRHRGDAAG